MCLSCALVATERLCRSAARYCSLSHQLVSIPHGPQLEVQDSSPRKRPRHCEPSFSRGPPPGRTGKRHPPGAWTKHLSWTAEVLCPRNACLGGQIDPEASRIGISCKDFSGLLQSSCESVKVVRARVKKLHGTWSSEECTRGLRERRVGCVSVRCRSLQHLPSHHGVYKANCRLKVGCGSISCWLYCANPKSNLQQTKFHRWAAHTHTHTHPSTEEPHASREHDNL